MRRLLSVLALASLLPLAGCIPEPLLQAALAPSIDTEMTRCEWLSWPDARYRDAALRDLERSFVGPTLPRWKHLTEHQRRRLAACLLPLARLLSDPDAETRNRARRVLGALARYVVWPGHPVPQAPEAVSAILADAQRLDRGPDLEGEEVEHRDWLLAQDLDVLSLFGSDAAAALPLADAVLARPDVRFDWDAAPPYAWRMYSSLHETARRLKRDASL